MRASTKTREISRIPRSRSITVIWPHVPFLCPGDAMTVNISEDKIPTHKKAMNLRNIQLQNICENIQLPNRTKRKRCYDVTSPWRMKQELGHLASGLECTGPAGGETQDVFFWHLAGPAGAGQ